MNDFSTLCAMIDCSRNGVLSVPAFRRLLHILKGMGYNAVMLYTEDTWAVEGEPFFGYKRGRYSMAELKAMDEFAASQGVELIPCIQTLAHLGSLFRWDRFAPVHDMGNALLADEEETYALIEKMFDTARQCFTSRRIHIGMDEAAMMGRGQYLDRHGAANRYEVLLRHLSRVCGMAEAHGFSPILWDDMFFKMETGTYLPGDFTQAPARVEFSPEVRAKVPDGAALCHWDYLGISRERYESPLASLRTLTDHVWFAGGVYDTMNFAPSNRLALRCANLAVPACRAQGVRNLIVTVWGDVGKECSTFAALPGFMAWAAAARGLDEAAMKADFKAITGEDYDAMASLDCLNDVYGTGTADHRANFAMTKLYNDPFLGLMDKCDDPPADPAIYARYAADLSALAEKSANFAVLYRKEAALARVLEKKFDLGRRTRALYAAGDKVALRALADGDYAALPGLITEFWEAFREEWHFENKSYGMEIMDIRLGGLQRRLEDCRRTLLDCCEGRLDTIEELEEETLPTDGEFVWYWRNMVSACPHGGEL